MRMENVESPPAESPPTSEDSAPGIIQFGDDAEYKLPNEIYDIKQRILKANYACELLKDKNEEIDRYKEICEKKKKECKQISEEYKKISEENKKLTVSNNQNKAKIFALEETIELNKKFQQKYEKQNNESEIDKYIREIGEKKKEINQLKIKINKIERDNDENKEAMTSKLSVYEKKCKDYEQENKELKKKLGIKSPVARKRKNQQLPPPTKIKKKDLGLDMIDDLDGISAFEENALKEFMVPDLPLIDEKPTPMESSLSNSSIDLSEITVTFPKISTRDSSVNTDEILKPKKVDKQIMTDEFYSTKENLPSIDKESTSMESSPSNSLINSSKIITTATKNPTRDISVNTDEIFESSPSNSLINSSKIITTVTKNPTRDSSVTTDEIFKPEKVDKQILTDEFYNTHDNVYPLFCSKCNKQFDILPIDTICKVMTTQPPPLLTRVPLSPMKRLRKSQNFHELSTIENDTVIANRFETLEKRVNVCEKQLKNIDQHSSRNSLIGSPQLDAVAEFLAKLGSLASRDSLDSHRRRTSNCLNNRKSSSRKRKLSSLHDSDVCPDSPVHNGIDSGDDFENHHSSDFLDRTSTTCYKENKLQEPQLPGDFEEYPSEFDPTARMSESDFSLESFNHAEAENDAVRKRKKTISASSQSNLLKKVRNLKKNSSAASTLSKTLNTNQETDMDSSRIIIGNDSVCKKKPRVAHAPKNVSNQQNMINDDVTEKLNEKIDISGKGLLEKRVTRSINKNLNKPVEQKKKFKLPVRMTKQIMALKSSNEDGKNNHLGLVEDKTENETSKNTKNLENSQEGNVEIQDNKNIKDTNENCLLEKTDENKQIEESKNKKDNIENNIIVECEENNEINDSNCEQQSLDSQDEKKKEISILENEEKNGTSSLLENENDLDENKKETLDSLSEENVKNEKIPVDENEEKIKTDESESLPETATDNLSLKSSPITIDNKKIHENCGGPEEPEEDQEKIGENNANENLKPKENENKNPNESQIDQDKLVSKKNLVKVEEKKKVLETASLPEEASNTNEKTENDTTSKNLVENEQDIAMNDCDMMDDNYSELGDLQIDISPVNSPSPSLPEEDDQQFVKSEANIPSTPEKTFPKAGSAETPSQNLRKRQQSTSPTKANTKSPKKSRDSLKSSRPGTIGFFLDEYLEKNKEKATTTPAKNALCKKIAAKYREKEEKLIKEKLNNLINHPEWNTSLHETIKTSLLNTVSDKLVAKCIVEILCEMTEEKVVLNKNFTPPAPLLTDNERKIIVLVTDIETNMPEIFTWMYKGIERILFKFNEGPDTNVVSCLSRVYVTLSKIKKDRERVRIMCCDALYCLQKRAVIVLHAILTSWGEVLPRYNSSKDQYLQCCIGHVVTSNDYVEPKFKQIKRLIRDYYKYPCRSDDPLSKDLTDKLVDAFIKKSDKYAKTAILLLAKKLGTDWTYKNIIEQRLLKIISEENSSVVPNVIKLIGLLMKSFPKQDDGTVGNIIYQLRWLVEEGETTPEVQESLISALLCLSRFRFPEIALTVLNWQPTILLSPFVQEQLYSFYKLRKPSAWTQIRNRNFKNDKKILLTSRSNDNLITALQRKK